MAQEAGGALALIGDPDPEKKSLAMRPGMGLQISSLDELTRFCKFVHTTGLAPKDLNTPEKILVACQMGMELGLKLMAAIQHVAVIGGRPTVWGDVALALVQNTGELKRFKETFEGDFEKDDFKAICLIQRKGREDEQIEEFSIADAKRAGLWKKSGPWQTHPKRMLKMRARGFSLRDQFPDVLQGMYLREEMEGEVIDVESVREEPADALPSGRVQIEDLTSKPKPESEDSPANKERGEEISGDSGRSTPSEEAEEFFAGSEPPDPEEAPSGPSIEEQAAAWDRDLREIAMQNLWQSSQVIEAAILYIEAGRDIAELSQAIGSGAEPEEVIAGAKETVAAE